MSGAPALVLKVAIGGVLPAALLLWLALTVGGPGALRSGVDVLSCMPDLDPAGCVQRALATPAAATPELTQ